MNVKKDRVHKMEENRLTLKAYISDSYDCHTSTKIYSHTVGISEVQYGQVTNAEISQHIITFIYLILHQFP